MFKIMVKKADFDFAIAIAETIREVSGWNTAWSYDLACDGGWVEMTETQELANIRLHLLTQAWERKCARHLLANTENPFYIL